MKKQILSLGMLLFSGALFAQDIPTNQVPSVVINQFNSDFPKAKDVDWELKNNVYNVDFEQGWNKDFEVWYAADGKQLKVEEEIAKGELPKVVINTIKKNYPSHRIDNVEKITEGNNISYKIEIENRDLEQILFIDKNGTLIK